MSYRINVNARPIEAGDTRARGSVATHRLRRSGWSRSLGALLLLGMMLSIARAAVLPVNVTLYAAAFGDGTFVSVGANGAIYN